MVGYLVPPKATDEQVAKILVVDDLRAAIDAARQVLEAAGHTVIASDRPNGLPLLIKAEQPDLLLLDVEIPGMSGPAMLRAMRARGWAENLIVLLYSAKPGVELAKLVEVCGADGYIEKADTQSRLASVVAEYLAKPA
jgi:two-component system cell cycle response regulator DivK